MRTLAEIDRLASMLWTAEAADDPARMPKQLSFMVASVGKIVAEQNPDISQADFINAVIIRPENMKAIDTATNRSN